MGTATAIEVEVTYSPRAGVVDCVPLRLPPGSTLADAIEASGLVQRHALQPDALRAGIWSKVREPGALLRDRDRVEIYRALLVDPKEARRQRYKRHRERASAAAPAKSPPPAGEAA
jgi:putative ubiquitin-RnfH superfamily antitoxin RatB of RatAB toxin-antitoxin module